MLDSELRKFILLIGSFVDVLGTSIFQSPALLSLFTLKNENLRMISNVIAIFRKELQGYFASPLSYIIAGFFWLFSGVLFILMLQGTAYFQLGLLEQESSGIPVGAVDVASEFLQSFFGMMALVVLPPTLSVLSMGLYAEERKRGTLELLATSPLTNWSVAIGKLLGVVTFFIFIIAPWLIYEAIALSTADPPLEPTVPILAHVGLILLATALLSLGMFISSLTDSSILAALLTFILAIALLLMGWVSDLVADPFSEILKHLSLLQQYDNLVRGIVETSGLVLFASYIILGIFLTAQSIEALRFSRR